jgi:hypothetical protein
MDAIEDKVNAFAEQWQNYCLPDKADRTRKDIDALLAEIDRLTAECSTAPWTQTTANGRRRSCSI